MHCKQWTRMFSIPKVLKSDLDREVFALTKEEDILLCVRRLLWMDSHAHSKSFMAWTRLVSLRLIWNWRKQSQKLPLIFLSAAAVPSFASLSLSLSLYFCLLSGSVCRIVVVAHYLRLSDCWRFQADAVLWHLTLAENDLSAWHLSSGTCSPHSTPHLPPHSPSLSLSLSLFFALRVILSLTLSLLHLVLVTPVMREGGGKAEGGQIMGRSRQNNCLHIKVFGSGECGFRRK